MSVQVTTQPASNGADLVSAVEQWFGRFVIIDSPLRFVLALYILYSHAWHVFDFCPYLAISSPTKRCGKSTVAQLCEWLCCRAISTIEITTAALFRVVDQQRPTLIIDECEALSTDRHIRALLNAGFKRDAVVLRCHGNKIASYRVGCPKIVCTIGQLPETINDRCIPIRMERAKPDELREEIQEYTHRPAAAQLSEAITNWATAKRDEIVNCYAGTSVTPLGAREADLWRPLFSIAAVATPARLDELKVIALHLAHEKAKLDSDAPNAVRLLSDINAVFGAKHTDRLPTDCLLADLHEAPEGLWNGLTASKLAHLLRPFQVRPKQIWVPGQRNLRGYLLCDFRDIFARYLESPIPDAGSPEEDEQSQAA